MSNYEFRRWAREHPNFMTPHIISVSRRGNEFIEVSSGKGFHNEPIFGVTVAKRIDDDFVTGDSRSKMFFSKEKALSYAKKLKGVM